MLDLAQIPIPDFIQGESFKNALQGNDHYGKEYVIAEKTDHVYYDPMRCIRTKKFKYIWNVDYHNPMQISPEHSIKTGIELTKKLIIYVITLCLGLLMSNMSLLLMLS